MSESDEPGSQTRIQSVTRAVQLLLAVAESDDGLTAKALADQVGLSLPTTYHLITTLWAEGILMKDDRRAFRLGPRVAVIAEGFKRLEQIPPPYLQALSEVASRTGETAYISAWRGPAVRVLETAEGVHAVRVVGLDTGYSENLHARASGKLLLAMAPEEQRNRMMRDMRLVKLTEHTITSKAQLKAELDRIREDGVAFDRQEFQLGVDCVSAPIWVGDRVDVCITVSTPTERFSVARDEIVTALVEATKAVSDQAR